MIEVPPDERAYFKQLDERKQRLYVGLKAKLIGWHGGGVRCINRRNNYEFCSVGVRYLFCYQ